MWEGELSEVASVSACWAWGFHKAQYVGTAFGYYGMAWSLFSTVITRGAQVKFGKDAMVDIRFDTRSEQPASGSRPAN
jgi:hypothetical protein